MSEEQSQSRVEWIESSPQTRGCDAAGRPADCSAGWAAGLAGLAPDGVLRLGSLDARIVAIWCVCPEGNLDVVLTGKQRQHYLERHPEMIDWELHLPQLLGSPDLVCHNRTDRQMAIFYRRVGEGTWLRAAVVMQAQPGEFKHSVLSFRLARTREVRKRSLQVAWSREDG